MKKGTIFKNLWAGYDCYFIYQCPGHSRKGEAAHAKGMCVHNAHGGWEIRRAEYYTHDLRDSEHFPIVGHIDVDAYILAKVLDVHSRRTSDEADKRGKGNLQEV